MKSSDLITIVVVIALVVGGWFVVTRHHNSAEAGYYEPRPAYFDTDPASLPGDWTGWDAKVDVFIHHNTNRAGCEAIEYGWIAWRDRAPVIARNFEPGAKRTFIRTDHLENPIDFIRVPPIELPYDRGVNIDASSRLQRNQYLVNWAHKYGFRFAANTPNEWRDYYLDLKAHPGLVIVVPAAGHSMKECRTSEEEAQCQRSPGSMRCDDDRYSQTSPFLYPEWTTDESPSSVLAYVKTKAHPAPAKTETEETQPQPE
jgi:hypothetical protein